MNSALLEQGEIPCSEICFVREFQERWLGDAYEAIHVAVRINETIVFHFASILDRK